VVFALKQTDIDSINSKAHDGQEVEGVFTHPWCSNPGHLGIFNKRSRHHHFSIHLAKFYES
jgi:hypothetical protein